MAKCRLQILKVVSVCFCMTQAHAAHAQSDPDINKQHHLHPWGDGMWGTILSPEIGVDSNGDLIDGNYSGMNVVSVWDNYLLTGDGIVIGIVERGIDKDHSELGSSKVTENTLIDTGTNIFGAVDHGTIVAGLAAANSNSLFGAGVAYDASLVVGYIGFTSDYEDIASLILDMDLNDGIQVLSNSWQIDIANAVASEFLTFSDDLNTLASVGVTGSGRGGLGLPIISAAGNYSVPIPHSLEFDVPATITGAITVANADRDSAGAYVDSNFGPWIDVAAPGTKVRSASIDVSGDCNPAETENCTVDRSNSNVIEVLSSDTGTSGSAPVAAGVVALMLEEDAELVIPKLESEQVRRILHHTARKINSDTTRRVYSPLSGFSDRMGYGLVDALAAVSAAEKSGRPGFGGWMNKTWPAPVANLVVDETAPNSISISWTNPAAPSGGYQYGEYSGAMLVRFTGNIWDMQQYPRSAGSVDSPDLIWEPTAGSIPLPGSSVAISYPGAGGTVKILAASQINSYVDTEVSPGETVTYAVYTYNTRTHFGIPVFAVKPGAYPEIIPYESQSLSGGATDSVTSLDFLGTRFVNPYMEQGVIPDSVGNFGGVYHRLNGDPGAALPPDIKNDSASIELVYDLSGYQSAALSFSEILEVWGYAGGGGQHAEIRVDLMDAVTPSQLYCDERTILTDHILTTYNLQTRKYVWRDQAFDLSDYAGHDSGHRVRVTFELSATNVVPATITVNHLLGWMLDNIKMTGRSDSCEWDLNDDGFVDNLDLDAIRLVYQNEPNAQYICASCDGPCVGDFNRDGIVDINDEVILLNNYGACP